MNRPLKRLGFWLAIAYAALVANMAVGQNEFVIDDIRIEGLQRVAPGAVFVVLPVQVGDEIDDDLSARSIRALYDTGFFDDIRLQRDGDTLVIVVVENPSIGEITIEGNKKIKTEAIEEALAANDIAVRQIYNPAKVEAFVEGLRQEYKSAGRFASQVNATQVPLSRNRVELFIEISEGPIALIDEIRVVGNEQVSTKDILDEMKLSSKKSLGMFNRRNRYSRTKLTADLEAVASHYQNLGYINFSMISSQAFLSEDLMAITLVITVSEGEQYSFGEINVVGEQEIVDQERLEELVGQEEDTLFSRKAVNSARQKVLTEFSNEGYSLATVEAFPNIREEEKVVDIDYVVEPNYITSIRRIEFVGNVVTSDEVLRREMRINEGGTYSGEQIAASRARLGRLGFFDSVEFRTVPVPGVPDQVDIIVEVEEALTGTFSVGVGYSSDGETVLDLAVSQRNLFGTGNQLSAAVSVGDEKKELNVNYINPYHTKEGVARGLNFTYSKTDSSDSDIASYRADSASVGVLYRFPVAEARSLGVNLEWENLRLKRAKSVTNLDYRIKEFIDENPKNDIGKAIVSYRIDTRDRAIFPTSGTEKGVSAEVGAGDLAYYIVRGNYARYFSVGEKSSLKLSFGADYGSGIGSTEDLPFFRRFYAGGNATVRGFDHRSLGPRELCKNTVDGEVVVQRCNPADPIGGSFRILGRTELYLPLFGTADSVDKRFSVFVDAGNVFEEIGDFEGSEIRGSTGVAFVWLSPIGPLGISRTLALRKKPGDEVDYFQVTLGTLFD